MNKLDQFIDDLQEQIFDEARQSLGEKGFDRWRNPRFAGKMENPDAHGRVRGTCGDTMEIFFKFENNRVKQGSYYTDGCASSGVSGSFAIELTPLPGYLNLDTGTLTGVTVYADGEQVGETPLAALELAAGEHLLSLEKARYEPVQTNILIEGRATTQDLSLSLLPAWANVELSSSPAGATVSIDGIELGSTPLRTQVLEGEHEFVVKLAAHKAWTDTLEITAREDLNVPPITLEEADGLVMLRTTPANASITVDGVYQGQTPLELTLPPGTSHKLNFFLNGNY